MSHQHGTYLGGIRTLEGLRVRCRIDQDTGCWHWVGAFSVGRGRTKVPATYLALIGKTTTAMRAAVILSRGIEAIKPGQKVWARCRHGDCCNPAHMRVGTSAELGQEMRESGVWRGSPTRVAANTITMRKRSRFTDEQIAEMRASGLNGTQLAAKHGISKSHASKILRGDIWRAPVASNSSVFAWRPSA